MPDTRKENLLEQLRQVECELSPENLSCDGEASASYVRRKYTTLHAKKQRILKELRYTPSFKELYQLN